MECMCLLVRWEVEYSSEWLCVLELPKFCFDGCAQSHVGWLAGGLLVLPSTLPMFTERELWWLRVLRFSQELIAPP